MPHLKGGVCSTKNKEKNNKQNKLEVSGSQKE